MEMMNMALCIECGNDYEEAIIESGHMWKRCICGCTKFVADGKYQGIRDTNGDAIIGHEGIEVNATCSKCNNTWTYTYILGRKRHVCPECGGIPV